jgi:hypothetical protein
MGIDTREAYNMCCRMTKVIAMSEMYSINITTFHVIYCPVFNFF